MAKPPRPSNEVETTVVVMRRVAPERFDVFTGVVRGPVSEAKQLERGVSLMVGRGAAKKALAAAHRTNAAALGITVES